MTDRARAAYEARYQVDANDPAEAADLALFVAGYEAAAGTNAPLYDPRDVAFGAVAAHGAQSALHNAACDVPGLRNVPVEPTDAMANAGAQYAECGLPANAVFGYRAMIAAAPAQPAAGLVGLTHEEAVAAVTGPKSTGRWVDDITRALAQKNNLTEPSNG